MDPQKSILFGDNKFQPQSITTIKFEPSKIHVLILKFQSLHKLKVVKVKRDLKV